MDEAAIRGSNWTEAEVAACVDAYVDHLRLDVKKIRFNKAQLFRELSASLGRTPASIEFKFQNISAVLNEIGLEWIRGLAPAAHYQGLLSNAVEARVSEITSLVSTEDLPGMRDLASLYVEAAPERASTPVPIPDHVERLVRKFDPVERDMKNRALGEAGERLTVEFEKRFLRRIERPDLAAKVRWVSKEDGDGAGYDILSFDDRAEKKFIEVKTTIGGNRTPFFVSRNENEFSNSEPKRFQLFRLFDFRREPRAFSFNGPIGNYARLQPESYRADFRA